MPRLASGQPGFKKRLGRVHLPGTDVVVPKVRDKRPVPRALPVQSPVPKVSGTFLDVWGAGRGLGGRQGEEGAGLRLTPRCQERRPGGAASFPRIGLSGPGPGGGAPVLPPSQPRAPPGLSKPGGGSLRGFPERWGQEEGRWAGGGTGAGGPGARTLNLPGPRSSAPPAPPAARTRPRPPAAPAPLRSLRESGPGGRG